jgi:hypothetical protein
MNWLREVGFCVLTGLSLSTALADTWADGTISEIRVISTGSASNGIPLMRMQIDLSHSE